MVLRKRRHDIRDFDTFRDKVRCLRLCIPQGSLTTYMSLESRYLTGYSGFVYHFCNRDSKGRECVLGECLHRISVNVGLRQKLTPVIDPDQLPLVLGFAAKAKAA